MRALKVAAQLGALALVLALLGLLAWKVVDGGDGARAGDQAPAIDLPELDGTGRVNLSTFGGRVLVINFWASWCGPCRDEAPLLQQAWERHRGRDVVVLGVDTRDLLADARTFVREFGITYPNGYDGPGRLFEPYGLTGLPETFFVDRNGRIVEHVVGPLEDAQQIEDAIEDART